mmetsp:Transcript_27467/g.40292  ORF Transcript_27467/g.40292 Transcript_27467/m.40292 type:complete len:80 (+) Transcript_27467:45-284(+)
MLLKNVRNSPLQGHRCMIEYGEKGSPICTFLQYLKTVKIGSCQYVHRSRLASPPPPQFGRANKHGINQPAIIVVRPRRG